MNTSSLDLLCLRSLNLLLKFNFIKSVPLELSSYGIEIIDGFFDSEILLGNLLLGLDFLGVFILSVLRLLNLKVAI